MNILITGSNGYIAQAIFHKFKNIYNITQINRQTIDLTDSFSLSSWFKDKYFDVVIHTAIVGGNRLLTEDADTYNQNIVMFKNLLDNKNYFNKLITFGSGAEIFAPNTPYGSSKKYINSIINTFENFYNLRIYAVFDHNENDRRFIKSNILRYMIGENLIIHKDRFMDFIYMPDLLSIIEAYLINNGLPKTIDCVYNNKYKLSNIAQLINQLDHNKKSNIKFCSSEIDNEYIGNFIDIGINFIGLTTGISNTFNIMVNNYEKNMVCTK
jgi:dTDP-4-dehydrorhamnose reductase